jgi:hypothetical protein
VRITQAFSPVCEPRANRRGYPVNRDKIVNEVRDEEVCTRIQIHGSADGLADPSVVGPTTHQ